MECRIGYGFDVHELKTGLNLFIGGIKILHTKGCVAHSDGDVLIHAICDALLGAVSLGDIGSHFPDSNDKFKDIDSKILLKRVSGLLYDKGYSLINLDSTICLQKPKLQEYIPEMRTVIADILNTNTDNVSIKATTTEKLGFVGKEKGITAHAVVLIKKLS